MSYLSEETRTYNHDTMTENCYDGSFIQEYFAPSMVVGDFQDDYASSASGFSVERAQEPVVSIQDLDPQLAAFLQ